MVIMRKGIGGLFCKPKKWEKGIDLNSIDGKPSHRYAACSSLPEPMSVTFVMAGICNLA